MVRYSDGSTKRAIDAKTQATIKRTFYSIKDPVKQSEVLSNLRKNLLERGLDASFLDKFQIGGKLTAQEYNTLRNQNQNRTGTESEVLTGLNNRNNSLITSNMRTEQQNIINKNNNTGIKTDGLKVGNGKQATAKGK